MSMTQAVMRLVHQLADPEMARRAPWRLLGLLRARVALRSCETGTHVWCGVRVAVDARGRIRIGDRVQFFPGMLPVELRCEPGGELEIGPQSLVNYGVSIQAAQSVRIGTRSWLGTMVRIRDCDGRVTAPVVIGEGVWLAHGVLVEPGVTIGDGAVVSAGSVVTSDVPAHTLATGNPARCVPLRYFSPRQAV